MSMSRHTLATFGLTLLTATAVPAALPSAGTAAPEPLPAGVTVRELRSATVGWRVVTVDLHTAHLRLLGQRPGEPHGFAALDLALRAGGERLAMGMNAGIWESVTVPSGLFVEDGVALHPLNRGSGTGNFFWKPNGVFWVDAQGGHVAASPDWPGTVAGVVLATQSGPLLASHGALHPGVAHADDSRTVRNGVGMSDPWTVQLALSERAVSLHEMAEFFVADLGAPDALYLDGAVSDLCIGADCDRASLEWAGILAVVDR